MCIRDGVTLAATDHPLVERSGDQEGHGEAAQQRAPEQRLAQVGVHRPRREGDDRVVDQFHHRDRDGVSGQRHLDRSLEVQAGPQDGEQRERVAEEECQPDRQRHGRDVAPQQGRADRHTGDLADGAPGQAVQGRLRRPTPGRSGRPAAVAFTVGMTLVRGVVVHGAGVVSGVVHDLHPHSRPVWSVPGLHTEHIPPRGIAPVVIRRCDEPVEHRAVRAAAVDSWAMPGLAAADRHRPVTRWARRRGAGTLGARPVLSASGQSLPSSLFIWLISAVCEVMMSPAIFLAGA